MVAKPKLKQRIPKESNRKPKEDAANVININTLRQKEAEIIKQPNDLEIEIDFRRVCSAWKSDPTVSDPLLMQAYQNFVKNYQKNTSLYNVRNEKDKTYLEIYNTETETKEIKVLETPECLNFGTCIAKLPNNKLFCFGKENPVSGIALIVNQNFEIEMLPSGTPCQFSSGIYFNDYIYCFGGLNNYYLTLSRRFDLNKNRWIQLTPMPRFDILISSVIFMGNILITGYFNRNILLYSIDTDSFTIIPYNFAEETRKILINAESLYLIECKNGLIYESEIGREYAWNKISNSTIGYDPFQVYTSYNKGAIYIAIYILWWDFEYIFDRKTASFSLCKRVKRFETFYFFEN